MSDGYVPRAGCDLCGKYATYDLIDGRLVRTEHWCAAAPRMTKVQAIVAYVRAMVATPSKNLSFDGGGRVKVSIPDLLASKQVQAQVAQARELVRIER